MTPEAASLWVIGDAHGEPAKVRALLFRAGLLNRSGYWSAGAATLVFIGDYVDRGPDGIGMIELVMRLEVEAQRSGGEVIALLGNHEPLLLAARRFGSTWRDAKRRTFYERWLNNRGRAQDMMHLATRHVDWISARPAVARVGSYLFVHADTTTYLKYGRDVNGTNDAIRAAMQSEEGDVWDALLRDVSDRFAFQKIDGAERAVELLRAYGGERVVHGHTPIPYVLQVAAETVRSPLLYASGKVLNVDGGLAYHPDAGFMVRLGLAGVERVVTVRRDEPAAGDTNDAASRSG